VLVPTLSSCSFPRRYTRSSLVLAKVSDDVAYLKKYNVMIKIFMKYSLILIIHTLFCVYNKFNFLLKILFFLSRCCPLINLDHNLLQLD
jgi:hypothetical protein